MTSGAVDAGTATIPAETSWHALLARVNTFPTLPVIVDRIAALARHPETTARDIESVVATDQTLTARLLQLVNSPFYAFPKRIATISRAVGIIGFDALRNLAFSTSVIRLFTSESSDVFQPPEFWKHSIGTAIAAKEIARHLGEKQLEEFFVAGLVHDIGKLIHHEYLSEPFARAGRLALEQGLLLRDAEKEILGFCHDDTAKVLLKQWQLPTRLIDMVTDHHRPCRGRERTRDAAVVHLADILCRAKGCGSGGDNTIPRLDHRAWDALGLTVGHLDQVMGRMDREFDSAIAVLQA